MEKKAFIAMCLMALVGSIENNSLNAVAPPPTVVNCESLGKDWPVKRAADAWLGLVDRQDYVQSWISASPAVKCFHSADQWRRHMWALRCGYGQPVVRHLCDCTPLCDPYGFPKGNYYWLEYHTDFGGGFYIGEVLMLHCEFDCAAGSRWRVAHYHIQCLD